MVNITKKSEGLSMNLIVITAIALVVLVVLVAVFTGRMGGFTSDVDSGTQCVEGFGGECVSEDSDIGDREILGYGELVGCDDNQICVERE